MNTTSIQAAVTRIVALAILLLPLPVHGDELRLEYNEVDAYFGRPSRVIRNGQETRIRYTPDGRVTAVETRSADGRRQLTLENEYDRNGQLIIRREADGTVTRYTYDTAGRVIVEEHEGIGADGRRMIRRYERDFDAHNDKIREIGPDGVEHRFRYDNNGMLARDEWSEVLGYNEGPTLCYIDYLYANFMKIRGRAGNATEAETTSRINALLSTRTVNGVVFREEMAPGPRLRARGQEGRMTRYRESRHIAEAIAPDGSREVRYRNWLQADTGVFQYNSDSTLLSRRLIEYDSQARVRLVWTGTAPDSIERTYDRAGNLLAVRGPGNHSEKYYYDGLRALVRESIDGIIREYTRDQFGRVCGETGPQGVIVREYDGLGNILRENGPRREAVYEHDAAGRLVGEVRRSEDGMARISREHSAARNLLLRELTVDGETGRILREERFAYMPWGAPRWREMPGLTRTDYTYDTLLRLVQVSDSAGRGIAYGYNNYGEINREEFGGAVTRYSHDVGGRIEEIVHADGAQDQFVYDGLGRVIEYLRNDGMVCRYAYDPDRTWPVTTLVDGREVLRSIWSPTNRLLKRHTALVREEYRYDDCDRLCETAMELSGSPRQLVNYEWDQDRMTKLTAGTVLIYGYDAGGRLESISRNGRRFWSASEDTGIRWRIATGRNALHDVVAETVTGSGNPDKPPRLAYDYDAAGRLTGESWLLPADAASNQNGSANYRYDAADRLIGVSDELGQSREYTYDNRNNRIRLAVLREGSARQTTNYTCNLRDELLVREITGDTAGEERFTYDAAGRMRTRIFTGAAGSVLTTQYVWDDCGNLVRAIFSDSRPPVTLTYDGGHRLVQRSSAGLMQIYLYDATTGNLVVEADGGGRALRTYLTGRLPGQVLGMLMHSGSGGREQYWQFSDGPRLARCQLMLNGDDVVRIREFDEFGVPLFLIDDELPVRWGGGFYDRDLGMYYSGMRWYDPVLGRFISRAAPGAVPHDLATNLYSLLRDPHAGICESMPAGWLEQGGSGSSVTAEYSPWWHKQTPLALVGGAAIVLLFAGVIVFMRKKRRDRAALTERPGEP